MLLWAILAMFISVGHIAKLTHQIKRFDTSVAPGISNFGTDRWPYLVRCATPNTRFGVKIMIIDMANLSDGFVCKIFGSARILDVGGVVSTDGGNIGRAANLRYAFPPGK